MQTRAIPRQEWKAMLDQFSRTHVGQPAEIKSARRNEKPMHHALRLPLIGITSEMLEDNGEEIEIIAGSPLGIHCSHTISRPSNVRMAEWNDAISGLLEIEQEDGTKATIQVGPAEQILAPGMITDGFYQRDL
jgi:hypothetical protein